MPHKNIWTIEKIKDGFEKFFNTYGRYPTALEIDSFDFLLSSRQIQRKFGGLPNLRKILNLPIENYGSGEERSSISSNVNKRGRNYENIIYELLKKNFDEKFIHIEKPLLNENLMLGYSSKNRYDFYVYAKPNNFAIDVFGTDNSRGVKIIMNIKEKKYIKSNSRLIVYFIYFGKNINDADIISWINKKTNKFPINWIILNFKEFQEELKKYSSYKAI